MSTQAFSFTQYVVRPTPDTWKVRMDFEDSDREEDDEKCDEEGQIFAGEDLGTSETTQLTDCSQETKPRIVSEGKENGLTTKQAMARRRSSQTMKKNTDIEKQTINKKNIDPVNNYKGTTLLVKDHQKELLNKLMSEGLQDIQSQKDGKLQSLKLKMASKRRNMFYENIKEATTEIGYVKLCLCGISLIIFGYVTYIVNPLIVAKDIALALKEGSYLTNVWKSPPIKLYIKAYLFNVTNSERFMKGLDKKLIVKEIGPYVYSESLENTNVTWNDNDTVSFTPRRQLSFVPELSASDPNTTFLILPNVPMLGIASMLHNSSFLLNMALRTVINHFKAEPLVKMSVEEFLWGYDDQLVEFASRVLPSWISFKRFGLLERMTNEGENRVTVSTKLTNETVPFTIQMFNGRDTMKQWTDDDSPNNQSNCNSLKGALEGLLLPRDLDTKVSVSVYRKAFCRTLPMVFINKTVTDKGFPMYLYTLREDAFDTSSPDNACFCRHNTEPCLPKGLSDMAPCYYGIPVAMSLPHFYKSDNLLERSVEGLQPEESKHSTIVGIQPDSGVPLFMTSRLQMNLIVKKVKYISKVMPFNEMIIPIIWLQVELEEIPAFINMLLNLLLITGPILQWSIIGLLFLSGLVMLFTASLRYVWQSGFFSNRPTATMISYNKKQAQEERTKWVGQYGQFIPLPISPLNGARSR